MAACGGGGGAAQTAAAAPLADAPATAASAASAALPFAAPTASDINAAAPVVFNTSRSARGGDIVSLQGENFGSAPLVWLDAVGSTAATPLTVVNQVGTGWMAVQIPAGLGGALSLRVSNGLNLSKPVLLNAATPHHLDTTQLVAGGRFRLFGRNLQLPGYTPSVSVDGLPASVDVAASDEHMLSLSAPAALRAGSKLTVTVDNGNGTGAAALDTPVAAVVAAGGDPLGLGVGWAAAYTPLLARTIDVAGDKALAKRMACDGITDDSAALQNALQVANIAGGAVLNLPAGRCRLGSGVQMLNNTVLQGAGMDKTELLFSSDAPLYADRANLFAIRNLTLTNTGSTAGASLNLKNSNRVAVQNVRVNEGAKAMAWLYGNENIVVSGSEFLQTGSLGAPGAVHASGNTGLVFTGNRVAFLSGTGTNLDRSRWAYVQGNSFTRDAARQSDPGVVHTVTLNFVERLALVGNSFTSINGPVSQGNNDSETILTEGGGALRTEGLGFALDSTANTLRSATSASLNPNVLDNGLLPPNYGIAIVAGKGAGQARRVSAYSAGTYTVDRAWDVRPDSSSRYATAVWGLQMALIKGNALSQAPRGIWLYSTAVRDVDIVGNTMTENGGILLRLYQNEAGNTFQPAFNLRIEGNSIRNTKRLFGSYLSANFANMDGKAVGTASYGLEVRRNTLVANAVNMAAIDIPEVGQEGFVNSMWVMPGPYDPSFAGLLGTVFQGNSCTNCPAGFTLSTGAVGTVIDGSVLANTPLLWANLQTGGSGSVKALFTKTQ